ncbi:MAG: hypothetical protein J6Y90_01465 [Lachnospiraceae bacterium]|nr:hypothetical protein [Lachnospiraceae bacterium]
MKKISPSTERKGYRLLSVLCAVTVASLTLFAACDRPEPDPAPNPEPAISTDIKPEVTNPRWRCVLEKKMTIFLHFDENTDTVSVTTEPKILQSQNSLVYYMLYDNERFLLSNDTLYQIFEMDEPAFVSDCGFTMEYLYSNIILLKAFGYGYFQDMSNYVSEYTFIYE